METAQQQHVWLERFVGNWLVETECIMSPDQPAIITIGKASVRMLGPYWMIMEGVGTTPQGEWSSVMTVGYQTRDHEFRGTFIASMMSYLWMYSGGLNANENELILDAKGPSMSGDGDAEYQDILAYHDSNSFTLRSQIKTEHGWVQFMTAQYRRS